VIPKSVEQFSEQIMLKQVGECQGNPAVTLTLIAARE
jgi:hypothetical protein